MADVPIDARVYGTDFPLSVATLHGGPGAAGYMAPISERLASRFGVLEPYQRGSSDRPCTVAMHVADLRAAVGRYFRRPPVLVGHSWGAMLALAYAAEFPDGAAGLVLIGCGTFDETARAQFAKNCSERIAPEIRSALDELKTRYPDPDERLAAEGRLISRVLAYDPVDDPEIPVCCDARAHAETWADMLRRQRAGDYPAAFTRIAAPVIMLHGKFDQHPGGLIYDGLKKTMPQIEYVEFGSSGHQPWLEKRDRERFFEVMIDWIGAR